MITRDSVRDSVRDRVGTTLVELLVVLLVLGFVYGMSALALGPMSMRSDTQVERAVRRARADAIRGGRPVVLDFDTVRVEPPSRSAAPAVERRDTTRGVVLFLPDGRAIGSAVDALTGTSRMESDDARP
jgi:type II secretory pathway pseudopilin PulG